MKFDDIPPVVALYKITFPREMCDNLEKNLELDRIVREMATEFYLLGSSGNYLFVDNFDADNVSRKFGLDFPKRIAL